MKRLINRLLAVFGLVSARRYQAMTEQAERLKVTANEWKTRASEVATRVRELEADVKRSARLAQKSKLSVDKMRQRRQDIDKLRSRLADAERELIVAREHLMAIEVKLDILEGAANVLEIRTRSAVSQHHNQTSAPA